MIAVVVSRADPASLHICEHLLDLADWTSRDDARPEGGDDARSESGSDACPESRGETVHRRPGIEIHTFEALHLDLAVVADAVGDPDLVVFASKHAGETGPLLTAHHTGNFGLAEAGGNDAELAEAAPNAHARVIGALDEHAPAGYEVGVEGTHHGPSRVGAPSLFVELGSSEAEWNDPDGARAVARAIFDLQGTDTIDEGELGDRRGTDAHRERQLVGLGGGHYAPRFERVLRETDWAVGHVAPDWQLDAMEEYATASAGSETADAIRRRTLREALDRSRATHVLTEGTRPEIERALAALDCEVVTETWVRETTGVSLSLVRWAEDAIAPVASGLRFGDRARHEAESGDGTRSEGSEQGVIETLPSDLLAEVRGIDQAATRQAVAARALAFDTDEGGTQVAGRVALSQTADRAAIVEAFADLLTERYDAIERREDAIVARETAFDAERAHVLGVPEGPAFGRLAAGESVTVDGEEIPPEAVHEQREHRFPV